MKTQIKKSISLFLAVLMILSCWVWVAPQKASADNTTGQYYVRVSVRLATYCDNVGASTFTLYYKPTNGTGDETSTVLSTNTSVYGSGNSGQTFDLYSGYIDGWPTRATHYLKVNGGFAARTVRLEDVIVYVGKNASSCTTALCDAQEYECIDGGAWGSTEATPGFSLYTNIDPVLTSADSMGSEPLNCPAIGNTTTDTTTAVKPTYWDQYGVKWIASTDTSYHISATENGDELADTGKTGGFWTSENDSDQGYVSITSDMQKTFPPKSSSSKDYYMVATVTNSAGTDVKSSQKITVNFTQYTFTFNGDGSVSSLGSTIYDKSGNKLGTGTYAPAGYYGYDDETFPTNESVTAEGYTFMGFWTTNQPTSGYASYNAKTVEFAYPCSSSDYTAYKDMGAEESNGVVTVTIDNEKKKYYDAGTAWDTTVSIIDGNRTYYGWWLADDLSVKFYDVDGKFLDQPDGMKYGMTQNNLTWPPSSYSQDNPYVSGSFTYVPTSGVWVGIDGEVVSQSGYKFTHDLILTPQVTGSFESEYQITFVNPNPDANGNVTNIGEEDGYTYTQKYDYRETVKVPSNREVPDEISSDLEYSYEFLGWSTAEPINGRYHVLLEDADFDVDGKAVGLNKDWIVRNAATYYAVYRRYTRSYAVRFWYYDATANYVSKTLTVKYGDKITPPTDYVPYTYATGGFGYTFANWEYTNAASGEANLGYADTIVLDSENINVLLGAVTGAGGAITFLGQYGEGVPTPYTVTFKYKNADGEDAYYYNDVNHDSYITDDMVDELAPAEKYDNGEALVYYTDTWNVVEGAAEKETYDTDDLTSISPTSHLTLEAVYGNPKPFYTVTYIDGANTYSERVLTGTTLPAWTYTVNNDNDTPDDNTDDYEEDITYEPSMEDDEKGSYVFQGWYDEKQTATDYSKTNGNKYEATTEITSNVTLYPQFKFEPFTYNIKFMNYDGTEVIREGNFQYGWSIESLTAQANVAAQGRAADETYSYVFIGWDKTVPTFCEGKDMVFIAQYKPVYVYYDAKWYNSKLEDGNWVADKTDETYLLATTHHTYGSKMYTPSVDGLVCNEAAPDGQNYVFSGWKYKDAQGVEQSFVRGMTITEDMEFYATYTLTAKKHTVTTVVGNETETYSVADGDTVAALIPDPQSGYVDESKHNAFDGWYTDEDYTEAFDIENTAIIEDITIYAKFTESAHDYSNKELKTAPTYYEKGVNTVWCSCDKESTTKEEDIDLLTDNVKPTGTIYLGTQGSWSSEGDPAYNTDGNEVSLYGNADTDIIITANDTGDVNGLYNPAGTGIGVKTIKAFVFPGNIVLTSQKYGAAQSLAYTVYEDNSQDLTNTANFTVKLEDLVVADLTEDGSVQYEDDGITIKQKSLEDGETYIVYYYVTDKAGNMLNTKVRTAKFVYDITAPTFTLEGCSNAASIAAGIPTYCGSATVTGVEDGATLTVNGEVVEVTDGSYAINAAGNYLITVTDKAGNSYSKKIKVAAEHDLYETSATVTCTSNGYEKTVCIVCGYIEKEKTEVAIGHVMNTPAITPATCTVNGYSVMSCQNCDFTAKYEFELDENGDYVLDDEGNKIPLFPAAGHAYDTDENGDTIYTTVTEPKCMKTGSAEAVCTVCGNITESRKTISLSLIPAFDDYGITIENYYVVNKVVTTDGTEINKVVAVYTDGVVTGYKLANENEDPHKVAVADAHAYSSAIKTLKATCTEAGYTYHTCKYCGVIERIDDLEAKGHTSEWVVETKATCGANGTMIEKCSVCKTPLGTATEYDWVTEANGDYTYAEDADGNLVTKTDTDVTYYQIIRLPKTNKHTWEITTTEATEETEGETVYTCTVCGKTKEETIDKLIKYTVTFDPANGADASEVKEYVGESVNYDVVPVKANSEDGKYKYTFAGWTDADGKTVTLPIEVTGNITLTAKYTQSKILYTHQFKVPNTWTTTLETEAATYDTFAVLVGAKGDVRVPVATPVFALADTIKDAELKKLYTFEFDGWYTANGEESDFVVEGNATFYAKFTAKPVGYQVIFYNGTSYVWDTTVLGGETVEYLNYQKDITGNNILDGEGNPILVIPEKDSDEDNHYTFDRWYTDATLKTPYNDERITAKTRLYAGYTATAHSYDKTNGVVIQEATCTLPEITEYTCACGWTIQEQTDDALGHSWDDGVEEAGVTTYTCTRCDETKTSAVATHTVKFVNYNDLAVQTLTVEYGATADFTANEPVRAADKENTYTFAGWTDVNDVEYTTEEIEALEITKDWTFKAYYTETKREYRVSYVDVDNKIIQTSTGHYYGDNIPAFTGDTSGITKDYDATYHYVFANWSLTTSDKVTGDMVIAPEFTKVAHDYTITKVKEATCEEAGGKVKVCSCGIEQAIGEPIAALGHTDIDANGNKVEHVIIPAKIDAKGSDSYVCTRCGKTITKTLDELPSQTITITVYDKNGDPAANGVAKVTITNKADATETYSRNTNENGQAIFVVAAGQEWTVGVTEIKAGTLPDGGYGGTVGTDGTFVAGEKAEDESDAHTCSCTCHRDSFWGIIFRFFHKFIKIFTGKIGCCSDPDDRY